MASSEDRSNYYDIVIVGAGPVGLMLSTCLARWGYKIRHIDNRSEPTPKGRADGIQPRSLDLLRNMGLKSAIMAHKPARVYEVAFWDPVNAGQGIERTGTWASCPDFIDARYPFTTLLHQGLIERVFIADLEKNGVEIKRPWTITGFTSDEKANPEYPVQVELEHLDGTARESLRAKYLFGGEGARSFVRNQLNIGVTHKDPIAHVWGVMDGVVITDFPDIKMKCTIHSEHGSIMVIPRENNMVRLYIQIASSTDPDWNPRKTATEAEVQQSAKKILQPYNIEWESVDWYSVYPIGQGISDKYTLDQRVFLGGDACHTHSPKAGQGMNTAFLDAQNLAWKIHAVESGFAQRDILKTYEPERKEVAESLLSFDNRYAKLFSQRPPALDTVQAATDSHEKNKTSEDNEFIKTFKESCAFTSGYGVSYKANALNWSPDHPAKSTLIHPEGTKLSEGRLFINSDVTRVVDANVVHLEQEIPLNGSFRIFVFGGNISKTKRALQDFSKNLSNKRSFYSAYTREDIGQVSVHEKHNPHSHFFTLCTIFAAKRPQIEISRDVPDVLSRYRDHVYADDRRDARFPEAKATAHAKMGLDEELGGVVVVRPDGYVGVVVSLVEGSGTVDALNEYFSTFCTKKLGEVISQLKRFASPDHPRHSPHPNQRQDSGTLAQALAAYSTPKVCAYSKPATVIINGSSLRKRHAESTELELVASDNGINDFSAPIVIEREGQTFFEDAVERSKDVQPMRWVGIFSFWARMITSLYSAVSGFTGRLGQWINPKSYGVAEFRSYLSDNQATSNRVKLSREEDGQIRWIDRQTLSDLIDTYRAFAKSINQVWECMSSHPSRQEMNRILEPLRHALADNESDRATLIRGGTHDLCELFQLQFRRAFQTLDSIYEIGVIIKIRDQNETVPPVLDYHLSPEHVEMMNSIKVFLSAPTLFTVCKDVLRAANRFHVEISDVFLDQIILDLEAITHNLPAPSYVISQEFHDKLQETFPRPQRTDFETNLLLPGAFPASEEVQTKIELKPKSTLLQQAELSPIKLPVPEYAPPVIARPKYSNADFIRTDMLERSISEMTPRQCHERFYHESEARRSLGKTFITELAPKVPLTATDVTTIKSILKNKRKHPSRCTSKRLGIRRPPKSVRFTDSTVSPQPRTRIGLDVPRIINNEVGPTQEKENGSLRTGTIEPEDTHPQDEDYLPWSILKSRHPQDLGQTQKEDEKKVRPDPDARIAELFALPSLKPLRISDDSHTRIVIQKEQAALKAEEEARRKAEADRLAAEEKARRELEERLAASGGLRLPSREFVPSLSAEWQVRARDTLRAAASTTLATTGEGVDLRRHDFAKVVPATEWLNDEIVNGSLNWLDQAVNSAAGIKDVKKSTRKCLAMSSFFYKRLQEQGVTRTQRTLRRYGVEKNNILDVDTILVPICEHSHWTLLIIRPSKRTVAHMDSLNPHGNPINTNLAIAWMKDVLEDKFDAAEWKVMRYEAPRQTNGHDCGVHTITNGMCLALGLSPIDCYAAADMPMQRIRIACMLLNGGFKGDFDLRVY